MIGKPVSRSYGHLLRYVTIQMGGKTTSQSRRRLPSMSCPRTAATPVTKEQQSFPATGSSSTPVTTSVPAVGSNGSPQTATTSPRVRHGKPPKSTTTSPLPSTKDSTSTTWRAKTSPTASGSPAPTSTTYST